MFAKFFEWVRGVINKMIGKSEIKGSLLLDVAISTEMEIAISQWIRMYKNEAEWLNDDVKSLNLPASIAAEFAILVTLEMKSEVTGSNRAKFLNEQYQKIIQKLDTYIEYANAGGGIVFKPYVSNGKILTDAVQADSFFPTEFDGNGNCISGVFIAQRTQNDDIYTKLEYHRYDASTKTHTITNKAYKSKERDTLGTQVALQEVAEWSNLVEEIPILNVEKPLFAYYKVPLANNIDTKTPLGVSVYSRAVNTIKDADKQYGKTMWEYDASEKAVFASQEVLQSEKRADGTKRFSLAKMKKRLYKALNIDSKDTKEMIHEYSPEIRDESFWRGFNKILQRIEFQCRLAYGTLSDPNYVEKTATEIKASKQRSYATVSKMQSTLQDTLEHLVYIYDVLADLYELAEEGNYDISFEWDDSLIVDGETEQRIRQQEVREGLRTKKSYIMYRYGYTEKQAETELQEIIKEKQEIEKATSKFLPVEE